MIKVFVYGLLRKGFELHHQIEDFVIENKPAKILGNKFDGKEKYFDQIFIPNDSILAKATGDYPKDFGMQTKIQNGNKIKGPTIKDLTDNSNPKKTIDGELLTLGCKYLKYNKSLILFILDSIENIDPEIPEDDWYKRALVPVYLEEGMDTAWIYYIDTF